MLESEGGEEVVRTVEGVYEGRKGRVRVERAV